MIYRRNIQQKRTTTFCVVLFDTTKSRIIKSNFNKTIKKRIPDKGNKIRQRLLSEMKLSDLKMVKNKKITAEIVGYCALVSIDIKYTTINTQKSKLEMPRYIVLYAKFIKSLGHKNSIVIDRVDTISFSTAIVNETNMQNVSWGNSKENIGIQIADIMLSEYKKV